MSSISISSPSESALDNNSSVPGVKEDCNVFSPSSTKGTSTSTSTAVQKREVRLAAGNAVNGEVHRNDEDNGHREQRKEHQDKKKHDKDDEKTKQEEQQEGGKQSYDREQSKSQQENILVTSATTTSSSNIRADASILGGASTAPDGECENWDGDKGNGQRKDDEEQQQRQADFSSSTTGDCKKRKYCNTDKKDDEHDKKHAAAQPKMASSSLLVGEEKIKEEIETSKDHTDTSATTTKAPVARSGLSLGRRGDPRMHRAVAARLAKPEISLFQALVIGGFKFPDHINEVSIKYSNEPVYDSDNILLSQRKNQLSRRLRHLRQRNQKGRGQGPRTSYFQDSKQALTDQLGSFIHENNMTAIPTANVDSSKNNFLTPTIGGNPFSVPSNTEHQLTVPNNSFFVPNYQAINFQQQHMQFLTDMANQCRLREQLSLYASARPPFPHNMSGGLGEPSHDALRSLANNLTPAPSSFVPTMQQMSSLPFENPPNVSHNPRMEHTVSLYDQEKKELKRRALVAAGFKENQIDESLLGSMNILDRNLL